MPSYCVATRAQVVCLKQYTHMTNDQITAITGVSATQIVQINKTAMERGYVKNGPLLDKHVADARRPGRPRKDAAKKNADPSQSQTGSVEQPPAVNAPDVEEQTTRVWESNQPDYVQNPR